MLERESLDDGWQVRLPVTGAALKVRLIPAVFLGVWLCGWGVGEMLVGGKLIASLRTIAPPGSWLEVWDAGGAAARSATGSPVPLPVLGFLALWLSLWTAGGVIALASLVGLVFGSPVVRWNASTLEFLVQVGPFARGRSVALSGIDRVAQGPFGTLSVSGAHGQLSLGPFADDSDRSQMSAWITEARRQAGASDGIARAA